MGIYERQVKDCHDIWGDQGLLDFYQGLYDFEKALGDLMMNHTLSGIEEKKHPDLEGHIDAQPTDPIIKVHFEQ